MSSEDQIQRTILPIPDLPHIGLTTYDAKDPDTKYPPIRDLRPPQGAPNVLIILIDDAGFGSSSAIGGPCRTPNAEKLAAGGLKYNRFHTTALCSPTRQALLTGRNHHSAGMGCITEIASGEPGNNSVLPNTMSLLARTLKLNGYSTAQFGKCHEVPVRQTSPVGPFDAWPTGGGGFEYFYGFIGGEANQWYPTLYEGTTPVEPNKTPGEGYHFMADMTDKAMAWIGQQRALVPDKPFFLYFAPGATHAPHHVPKEWADKYKGKFDQGWDKLREETFVRQKELGVGPDAMPRGLTLIRTKAAVKTSAYGSGWGTPGPGGGNKELRSQFIFAMLVVPRHPGLAMTIAALSYNPRKALPVIIPYLIVFTIVTTIYVQWRKRRSAERSAKPGSFGDAFVKKEGIFSIRKQRRRSP